MNRMTGERWVAAGLIVGSFVVGYWLRGGTDGKGASRGGGEGTQARKVAAVERKTETRGGGEGQAGQGLGAADLREEMAAALRATTITEKFMQLAAVLGKMSPGNWRGVLEAFEEARKRGEENPEAWALFVRRAGEVAGKEAVGFFVERNDLESAKSALTGWAATHPAEALQWLGKEASPETHRLIVGAAMRGLAASEPDLAASVLEGIPIERRKNYIRDFVPALVRGAGLAQTEEIVNGMLRRAAANGQSGDDFTKGIFGDLMAIKARRAAVSGDLAGLAEWAKAHVGQPYTGTTVVWGTAQEMAAVSVPRAIEWLDRLHANGPVGEPGNPMGYGIVLATWAGKDGTAAVAQWLQANGQHPNYDYMVSQYTAFLARGRPVDAAQAAKLAETIRSADVRTAAQKKIAEAVAAAKPKG